MTAPKDENSLFEELIKSSGSASGASAGSQGATNTAPNLESIIQKNTSPSSVSSGWNPSPAPKKPPMKPGEILGIAGAILFVGMVLFGSFLAYVILHPEEAQFFRSFNIEPARIADILRILVNSIFGFLTFAFSITWSVVLFKAYVTKWENRKKKTIFIILSVFLAILLFTNLSLWTYLVKKIGISDYANPNGGVIMYDNDLYLSKSMTDQSEITDSSNLIGPINIRFDLRSDAKYVSKFIDIDTYDVDFNGNGNIEASIGEVSNGVNPESAEPVVFSYTKAGTYFPKGKYTGHDKLTKEVRTMDVSFSPVVISGVVETRRDERKKTMSFDASSLASIGKPKWYESSDMSIVASAEKIYTSKIESVEKSVCLIIEKRSGGSSDTCTKVFVVEGATSDSITGTANYLQSLEDPLSFEFSVDDIHSKDGAEIVSYVWSLSTGEIIGNGEKISYSFRDYAKRVRAIVKITDTAGRISILESKEFNVNRPLELVRQSYGESLVKVTDESGNNRIILALDKVAGYYNLKEIDIPGKLTFNAEDVRVQENSGYKLENAEWEVDGNKKLGKKVELEFTEERRYDITATYTFLSSRGNVRETVTEKMVVYGKKKDLSAHLQIKKEGDYIPVTVRFDGSASTAKTGTIAKFIYDFGNGRGETEGDAIQTYVYDVPGEYTISLTVVKDDGTKDTTKQTIVIKNTPKQVEIVTSVSAGVVGRSVDFSLNATGQIESYDWNFGDGSVNSSEPNPTHTYDNPGKYPVTLNVKYTDGTIKTAEITFQVAAARE